VVKFQIENGGTVGNVNANAYIRVEKSADLSTWTSLQDIQLVAPETVPVKTDYAITIGDASARYIRIRIEGLVNSRSSRRETIRNIAVQLTPVITWNQDLTKFLISDIGGADTILDATTSSSADTNSSPITYTSSDANVAIVVENKLTVVGEGTAVITAKQPANKYYTAATDVVKNVTVSASLGTNSVEKAKENNFIFVNSEGIVSNIEGTLKVYAINGALLKNIAVSKNQVIPVDKGQYIVITTINGKSISKLIVK
jgi:hypothetical protein